MMHIRPWEIDLLTVEQFDAAIDWINQQKRETREAGES